MTTTSIEWIANPDGSPGKTWNPVNGCEVVSPGCVNCYAKDMAARFSGPGKFYEGLVTIKKGSGGSTAVWTGQVRAEGPKILSLPMRWKNPQWVFVNSMSDLFYQGFSDAQIIDVFAIMALTPRHTYVVLTKRAKRMRELLARDDIRGRVLGRAWSILGQTGSFPRDYVHEDVPNRPWPLPNVILGVSVEDQARADERIDDLLMTPAAVRMLSVEPMLGPIDLTPWLDPVGACDCTAESGLHCKPRCPKGAEWRFNGPTVKASIDSSDPNAGDFDCPTDPTIDWVVVGCESGKRAREFHVAWFEDLRDLCVEHGVKFFLKQALWNKEDGITLGLGSKTKGRGHNGAPVVAAPYLDGRQWLERPEVPRV